MNLKVRLRNLVFWAQILVGVGLTVLAYWGLSPQDMTTWGGLWELVVKTFSNPYCCLLMLSNVWNALNDPTTSGLKDSDRAKGYEKPLEK